MLNCNSGITIRIEKIIKMIKETLHTALFDLDSRLGKWTNLIGMAVIILSVIISMIGTLDQLNENTKHIIDQIELWVTLIFASEYLLRVFVARKSMAYIFSFYGIIDLMAWLPLLFSADPVFALRLLRILRLLKLLRYLKAIHLFLTSLRDVVDVIAIVLTTIAMIALIGGNVIYYLEPEHFENSFIGTWWGFVTMTTVGYGDMVPHSAGGKVVATVMMLIGIAIFALLTGTISVKINNLLGKEKSCVSCNRTIAISDDYCQHCGVEQGDVGIITCSHCGRENRRAIKFCPSCGTPVKAQSNKGIVEE